jgi:N-acetylneuraminic acid mutarotase
MMNRLRILACALSMLVMSVGASAQPYWDMGASMPSARTYVRGAALDGMLYVPGGYVSGVGQQAFEYYDPSTDMWNIGPAMPTYRHGAVVAAIGGKLYVAGGYTSGNATAVLEIFDPVTQVWSLGPPMLSPRHMAAGVAHDGKFYVAGGISGSYLASVEVYDPLTNTWAPLAPMSAGRGDYPGMAVADGMIYVIGGGIPGAKLSSVERYDPIANTWDIATSLPNVRAGLVADALNGMIYAVGGTDNVGLSGEVSVYDPMTDMWSPGPAMATPRATFAGAVVGGEFLAVGGSVDGADLATNELEILRVGGPPPPTGTVISGAITNLNWMIDGSPYHVVGPCTVKTATILYISAGVDVLFEVDVPLVIEGSIQAIGDPYDNIFFGSGDVPEWGGIRISGGMSNTLDYVEIRGGHADGSWPDNSGGGIRVVDPESSLLMTNSFIANNSADAHAGGLLNLGTVELTSCTVRDNYAAGHGGGIENFTGATLNMVGSVVAGNTGVGGGGIYNEGGGPSSATLDHCTITGNTSTTDGGGLFLSLLTTTSVTNTIIYGNLPEQITVVSGVVNVTYSDIQGGWTGEGNIDADPMFYDPSMDYRLTSSSPCIDAGDPASPLDPDETTTDMGAYWFEGGGPGPGTDISGAITNLNWNIDGSPYHVVGPCTVKVGNTLTINPGVHVIFDVDVPFLVEGTLSVFGDEFDKVLFYAGSSPEWGGIQLVGPTNNAILQAEISGGNADGASNPDNLGGGILVDGTGTYLDMNGVVVENCTAASAGGGIFVGTTSSLNINDCEIRYNNANSGGGLYVVGTVTMGHVAIFGNDVTSSGGALALGSNGNVTMTNVTIADNSASGSGGAIHSWGTVAGTNCIVWNNTSPPSAVEVVSGVITFSYSDVQGGFVGTGNIDQDPMFVDSGMDDYRLTADSPVINVGDPASGSDPDGSNVDMGAYWFDPGGDPCPECGNGEFAIQPFPFPGDTGLTAIAFEWEFPYITTGGVDGRLFSWIAGEEGADPGPVWTLSDTAIAGMGYTTEGTNTLLVAAGDSVYALDQSGNVLWQVYAGGPVLDLAIGSFMNMFAASSAGGGITFWMQDGTLAGFAEMFGGDVLSLAFHPESDVFFGGDVDGYVRAWETTDGYEIWAEQNHGVGVPVRAIAVTSNEFGGSWGVSGDANGAGIGWDLTTGLMDGGLTIADGITNMAIGPNGASLFATTDMGSLIIWNTDTEGEPLEIANEAGHVGAITDLTVDPSGGMAATVGEDGQMIVWDLQNLPGGGDGPDGSMFSIGVPDYMKVRPGEEFTLPIYGNIQTGGMVPTSIDLAFVFEPGMISPVADSLLVAWSMWDGDPSVTILAHTDGDTILVSIASANELTVYDETFLQIRLNALQNGWSGIWFVNWLTSVNEMGVETGDGNIEISDLVYGDVSMDLDVTAFDASMILQYVVRIRPEIDLVRADVTNNGQITGYDAAWVLLKVVDPGVMFPVENNPDGQPPPVKLASNPVALRWERAGDGWALIASNPSGIMGGDLKLRMSSDAYTVDGSGMIVHTSEAGVVDVSFARINDDPTLIRVDGVMSAPELVSASLNEGAITVSLPMAFTLAQNAPNPFNPSTTIRFTVAQNAPAKLAIYNTTGQLVRTLVDGSIEAGAHEIRWDGMDNAGRSVASGVYIYRLQSSDRVAAKRLTLVR